MAESKEELTRQYEELEAKVKAMKAKGKPTRMLESSMRVIAAKLKGGHAADRRGRLHDALDRVMGKDSATGLTTAEIKEELRAIRPQLAGQAGIALKREKPARYAELEKRLTDLLGQARDAIRAKDSDLSQVPNPQAVLDRKALHEKVKKLPIAEQKKITELKNGGMEFLDAVRKVLKSNGVGDSENKSIAPMVKVIPRSKRPMGKDTEEKNVNMSEILKRIGKTRAEWQAMPDSEKEGVVSKWLDKIRKERGYTKDASPFDVDTDAGAAKIVKREAKTGLSVDQIVKKYGFSKSFVEEEMPSAKGKDVKTVSQGGIMNRQRAHDALDAVLDRKQARDGGSWSGTKPNYVYKDGQTVLGRTQHIRMNGFHGSVKVNGRWLDKVGFETVEEAKQWVEGKLKK